MRVMHHLLLIDAEADQQLLIDSLRVYANYAEAEIEKHYKYIMNFNPEHIESCRFKNFSLNLLKVIIINTV